MYTVYFIFFQVASATATIFGLSRGLLGLQYDQINESESECSQFIFPYFIINCYLILNIHQHAKYTRQIHTKTNVQWNRVNLNTRY